MNKITSTWRRLRPWVKIVIVGFFFLFFLFFSTYLAFRAIISFEVLEELPSTKKLAAIENPFASALYSADGQLIGRFYTENRSPLKPDDINEVYRNALLATEDIRFFEHNGVDNRSLLRVLFKTILLQKEASGGGSTLTQQLAKNLYPRKKYEHFSTVFNKFREMEIARRLEKIYTKEEILVLYCNTISFGERAFGLPTAAERFFNKAPKDLVLEEAALLVGLLKATSRYSPRRHPERAKQRRNVVLAQMANYDFISDSTQARVSKLPIRLDYQSANEQLEFAGYFKQHVKREFNKWKKITTKPDGSAYNIYRDGLRIYTTIDQDLQIAAEQVLQEHMKKLQAIFEKSWKGGKMFGQTTTIIDNQITKNPSYKALLASGKTKEEAFKQFQLKSKKELWTWEGRETKVISKIDSIKHYLSLLHASVLAIAPKTGAIKTWVGGNDYGRFQYDNVRSARQVGSTFKPFVYLAALESGIEPCDLYENTLKSYPQYQNWTPKNAGHKYGGVMTVQEALTKSTNTVSVQVLFDTGIPGVIDMSKRLGIGGTLNEVPSIVLGTSDVTLYDMVKAYSTLANDGFRVYPTAITKITDKDGKVLFDVTDYGDLGEQVVDSNYVKTLNSMLQNATLFGTGRRLYQNYDIKFPISGKTGTTQNQSDGWFIGYNKDLAIGAWVGTEDRRVHFRNIGTGSGGRTALPLVAGLFEFADELEHIKTTAVDSQYFVVCESILEEEILAEKVVDSTASAGTTVDSTGYADTSPPSSAPSTLPSTDSKNDSLPSPSLPSTARESLPTPSKPTPTPEKESTATTTKKKKYLPPPPLRPVTRDGKLGKRFSNRGKNKINSFNTLVKREFQVDKEAAKAKRLKAFKAAKQRWQLRFDALEEEVKAGGY